MKLLLGLLAVVGGATWLLRKEYPSVAENSPRRASRSHSAPTGKPASKNKPKITNHPKPTAAGAAQSNTSEAKRAVRTHPNEEVAIHTPTAGYLDQILRELDDKSHGLERHDYLSKVVEEAYKERAHKSTAKILEYIAELHIKEFPKIRPVLKKATNGALPRVPTFQKYAMFLTEKGDYQRAIEVCQSAIEHGLSDGTKGDFPERIKRIHKKQTAS